MLRHDRARFVAFGLLPLVNVVALLIYGLYAATGGSSREGRVIPALLVIAAVLLPCSMGSAIKRGRDLGFRALITLLAFLVAFTFAPAVLFLLGYMALARPKLQDNPFGPPAPAAGLGLWPLALLWWALPWVLLKMAVEMG
jgi:hypothetical protein